MYESIAAEEASMSEDRPHAVQLPLTPIGEHVEEEEADVTTPPRDSVRKRLRFKQHVSSSTSSSSWETPPSRASSSSSPVNASQDGGDAVSSTQSRRTNKERTALRDYYVSREFKAFSIAKPHLVKTKAAKYEKRLRLRKTFKHMKDWQKEQLSQEKQLQEDHGERDAAQREAQDEAGEQGIPEDQFEGRARAAGLKYYRGQGSMLTYNGQWSFIEDAEALQLLPPEREEDSMYIEATDVEACCDKLRFNKQCRRLFDEFIVHVQNLMIAHRMSRSSACVELHIESSQRCQNLQVHLHWAFEGSSGQPMHIPMKRGLEFQGAKPHVSEDCMTARGRCTKKARDQGHYYVVAPKTGSIFRFCTHAPHHSYAVNPQWVTSLVATHKITSERAIAEYINCGTAAKPLVDNVKYCDRMRREAADQQRLRAIQAACEREQQPQRAVPEVECEFLPQFTEAQAHLDRRKFLVLDGRSRTGKSVFAKSLAGPGKAFEVSCATSNHPDLRDMVWGQHEVVIFDEAHTSLVIANKKLFQGSTSLVAMGNSATSMFTYMVCTAGLKMVVTTNVWRAELADSTEEDRLWLEANSVYVNVTEPLWEPQSPTSE